MESLMAIWYQVSRPTKEYEKLKVIDGCIKIATKVIAADENNKIGR